MSSAGCAAAWRSRIAPRSRPARTSTGGTSLVPWVILSRPAAAIVAATRRIAGISGRHSSALRRRATSDGQIDDRAARETSSCAIASAIASSDGC
jgi:hypothetical protein